VRAYVETNFVLELAFRQEQAESCRVILGFCEEGRTRLVLPAFSIVEALQAAVARQRERDGVAEALDRQIGQLARSEIMAGEAETLQPLTAILLKSSQQERADLRSALQRITAVADLIPLDAEVLRAGEQLERAHRLSAQDAVVLASVLGHLERSPHEPCCFLNRNVKDFDDPDVRARLDRFGCKLLPRFDSGAGYLSRPRLG